MHVTKKEIIEQAINVLLRFVLEDFGKEKTYHKNRAVHRPFENKQSHLAIQAALLKTVPIHQMQKAKNTPLTKRTKRSNQSASYFKEKKAIRNGACTETSNQTKETL